MTGHDTFDARLRAAHAVALDRLSPATQSQLLQRQRRALAARSAPTRPALRWVVASLVVGAVALGILHPLREAPGVPRPTSTTVATAPADTTEDNPDFYVWLASSDADSLASE